MSFEDYLKGLDKVPVSHEDYCKAASKWHRQEILSMSFEDLIAMVLIDNLSKGVLITQ